jgi:hypothetical protein
MSGNDEGMRAVIAAIQKNPLSAGTLFAVVVGGAIMFVKVTTDQAAAAGRIDTLTMRVERSETASTSLRDAVGDIRGSIREMNTNIQWLVRANGGTPNVPRELRDRDRGPQ